MSKNKKLIYVIIITVVVLIILFTPIPFRYGPGIVCKPCDSQNVSQCPKCPQEGDIGWNPSLFQSLLMLIKQDGGALESFRLEPQFYIACGCGCCPNVEPEEVCLYHSKGDSIREIIENDKGILQSPDCETMGCSLPIKYIYCD